MTQARGPIHPIASDQWTTTRSTTGVEYTCGYCGNRAGPGQHYETDKGHGTIYICPACNQPTFMLGKGYRNQTPGPVYGRDIAYLPEDIDTLYSEARRCMTVGAHTAVVLLGRKLLMHVAVTRGAADKHLTFVDYVDYLDANHYIPPDSRDWVDRIRTKGNLANHEIQDIIAEDAKLILTLVEALLSYIYEIPGRAEQMSQTA